MKKKFIGILAFIVSVGFSSSFAVDITITTPKTGYDINEVIILDVNINSEQESSIAGGRISINGLESFEQVQGQSQQMNFQNINGKTKFVQTITLPLKAKSKGEFTVGPAQIVIGTGEWKSNTLKFKISGNKMFVGNPTQTMVNNLKDTTKDELNKAPVEIKKQNNISNSNRNSGKLVYYIIIILAVILAGVYIMRRYLSKPVILKSLLEKEKSSIEIIIPSIKDIDFYNRADVCIRAYIGSIINKDIFSLTYIEIEDLLSVNNEIEEEKKKNIISLFKQLQEAQYAGIELEKKDIVKALKEII